MSLIRRRASVCLQSEGATGVNLCQGALLGVGWGWGWGLCLVFGKDLRDMIPRAVAARVGLS